MDGRFGCVADTRQELQRLLSFRRQTGEFPDHQIDDVVRVPLP